MILTNCRLIPELTGGIMSEHGTITVEGGKIVSVSPEAYAGPEAAFDCGGRTLLPGLIDMHTHITLLSGVGENCKGDPLQFEVEAARQARYYLKHGFTTIRSCGEAYRVSNYIRDMINEGLLEGPTILSSGCTLYSSVAMKPSGIPGTDSFCDGPEEFTRGVRVEMAYGADQIKIYASGSAYNPTGAPLNPIMTDAEIKAATDAARMNNTYVAAHAHADSAIRACIANGVRTIEHATYLSEETLALLLQTEDCYLVPTLSAMYVNEQEPVMRQFWIDRLTPMLEASGANIERAYRAGAVIGFGTDSAPGRGQYENGVEFQYRKEYCHMADLEILLQATKVSAEILGLAGRKGELIAGADADLVLVDGKPDEDISVMYRRPEHVWKGGKQFV
ncbi:MAG: amidohydrolase family protein [Mogibacterium sp.]|nr:amidohydrolase family protein [Mogibacterium sp.]